MRPAESSRKDLQSSPEYENEPEGSLKHTHFGGADMY
jgi:hypothetical protein